MSRRRHSFLIAVFNYNKASIFGETQCTSLSCLNPSHLTSLPDPSELVSSAHYYIKRKRQGSDSDIWKLPVLDPSVGQPHMAKRIP
jgi:hypothetical protein